jgi:ribosomal protein S18 acetylase RimI-like enzyme
VNAEFLRALRFEHAMRERMATEKITWPWGTAFFNSELPLIYDQNYLRVEKEGAPAARDLVREADGLMGPRGFPHRKIVIDDENQAGPLVPAFTELGWEVNRLVVMVHRAAPRREPRVPVDEIAPAVHTAARTEFNRREPYFEGDEKVLLQMRDAARLHFDVTDKRCFAAYADDKIASICELYSDGVTAQIEDVSTLEEYRGRGLATAVVLRALREAQTHRHDFVFLVADDDDWPKQLYAKLGFEAAGRTFQFLRRR